MYKAVEAHAVLDNRRHRVGPGLGARIAQEKLGVPFVSAHLQPAVFRSYANPPLLPGHRVDPPPSSVGGAGVYRLVDWEVDRMLAPEINRFRMNWGLAPVRPDHRSMVAFTQRVSPGFFPEWFAPGGAGLAGSIRLTQFHFTTERSRTPLLPAGKFLDAGRRPLFLPRFRDEPGGLLFHAVVKACEILGCRGILLTSSVSQCSGAPSAHVPLLRLCSFQPRPASRGGLRSSRGIGTTAQALAPVSSAHHALAMINRTMPNGSD